MTVVSYPKDDEKTLLNINPNDSLGIFTYFFNNNEDFMVTYNKIEKNVHININEYSVVENTEENSEHSSTPDSSSIKLTYNILENNEYSIVYRVRADISNVTKSTIISIDVNQATVSNPKQTINSDTSIYWDVVVLENDATISVSREDSDFTRVLLLDGKGVKQDETTNISETSYNYNGTYKGTTTTTYTSYEEESESNLGVIISEAMCQPVKITMIIDGSTITGQFGKGSNIDEIKGYTISNTQIKGTTSSHNRTWSGNLSGIPKDNPKYNSAIGNGATITGTWSLENRCSGNFELKQI